MSYTGITRDELVPVPENCPKRVWIPALPRGTWTVPLPAACAALVRIAARETRHSMPRMGIITALAGVVTHSFFDMSYEGDYMEIIPNEVPLSEEEVAEIQRAVSKIREWRMREGEDWIRDFLVQIVAGEKGYDDLPTLG